MKIHFRGFLGSAIGIITIVLFTAVTLSAQTGRVNGTITDSQTGEPLAGANVVIGQDSPIGAATDLDGNYTVTGVPIGTHTITVTYIGYKRVEREVTVAANQQTNVDIEMTPESVRGEEVVVTAQAKGQLQAINQQIASDKIANIVSEAKIREMPDFNAAQAIGRLPGVSTEKSSGEANKVVIRGLSPKYNSIEVEGVKLSATGSSQIGLSSNPGVGGTVSNDRSVDLTMVSPYMVRTISVYKSLTPDMNANSIGGTVNMELREAPRRPHFSAMWQQGYTAKSNTYGNYRAVLSGSRRFLSDRLGVYVLGNIESYDRDADNMGAGYAPSGTVDSTTGFRPVEVRSVSLRRHVEARKRYGANLILDYNLPNGSIKAVNMFARLNSDYADHNQNFDYANGGIGWSLRLGENIIDQQMNALKLDYDLGFMTADLSASYTSSNNVLEDSPLFNFNQTGGLPGGQVPENEVPENLDYLVEFFGNEDVKLRSANLLSSDYEEEKYSLKGDFQVPYNLGANVNGFLKFGGQYDIQSNSNDQETPYAALNQGDGEGIQGQMMRSIESRFDVSIDAAGDIPGTHFRANDEDLYDPFWNDRFGDFYYAADRNILTDILNYLRRDSTYHASTSTITTGDEGGWYDGPYQQLANDYNYEEDYYAAYLMSKLNFKNFMVIGGVRYEKVESNYFAYNARDLRNAKKQKMYDTTAYAGNEHFLPMGQVKYTPLPWMDVRYAYTQSLARPDYSQLSPKFTITQGSPGTVYAGNPDLNPAIAYNHDLNLTFHGNTLGLFSVGAFYKEIKDFTYSATYELNQATRDAGIDSIERYIIVREGDEVVRPKNNATVVRPINNPYDATVRGLELDLQTNFWYLPAPLNNLVFGINYSRIHSELRYPIYETEVELVGRDRVLTFVDSSRAGRLVDQPNDIVNSYIGYDYKGFSSRLSFIYQGNSVDNIGRYPEQDGFTTDYFRIDFSVRQRLPIANSELFLDITNLNDENNSSAQRTTEGFNNIQNYGLTANLGIRIRY